MKLIAINRQQVYRAVMQELKDKSDTDKWTVELKKYRPSKTLKQNGFFHLVCDYIARHPQIQSSMKNIKQSVYENHPLRIRDPLHADKFIIKTIADCDIDQAGHYIESAFIEAAEQSIDMREFITEWEEIKRRERENDHVRDSN